MATMNVYGECLEPAKAEKVLLYSSGMDSWICFRLWQPSILLYCCVGSRAQPRELEVVPLEARQFLITDYSVSLAKEERLDAIIPLRNLYFLARASRYGDSLAMGVLAGEVNGDKSEEFRKALQATLNACYRPSYWCEGRQISIEFPISHLTKAEAITEYLRRGFSAEELLSTRSCYSTTLTPCGICSNCVKRYIALTLNGLKEPTEQDPRLSPMVQEMRKRFSTYDVKRQVEFLKVFGG